MTRFQEPIYDKPAPAIVQSPYDPKRNQTVAVSPQPVQPPSPATGGDPSDTLAKAGEYLLQGNIQTANKLFRRAAEANPRNFLSLTEYARTSYLLGRIREAHTAYLKALNNFPILSGIKAWLGYLSLLRGNIQGAFRWTQEELKSDPNSGWAHSVMGSIYLQKNDVANANVAFATAVYRDHRIINSRFQNGKALHKQGIYALAIFEFLAAACMNPKDPIAYFWLGLCNVGAGNAEMAITWYQNYLQRDSASQRAEKARAEIERMKRTKQNVR
jgi:tetratricopeptide (TPR) repeat protein